MILAVDSPLRRIPTVSARERIFLDGFRYAVDIADLSGARLRDVLLNATMAVVDKKQGDKSAQIEVRVSAVLWAWSIVDAVYRLQGLINTRGTLLKSFPAFEIFIERTQPIRKLRNIFDHLGSRIEWLASKELPVHGVLTWFATLSDGRSFAGLLKPGTFIGTSERDTLINPLGRERELPVGLVTLTVGSESACLSDVLVDMATVSRKLETVLHKSFEGHQPKGGDLLVLGHFEFHDPSKPST